MHFSTQPCCCCLHMIIIWCVLYTALYTIADAQRIHIHIDILYIRLRIMRYKYQYKCVLLYIYIFIVNHMMICFLHDMLRYLESNRFFLFLLLLIFLFFFFLLICFICFNLFISPSLLLQLSVSVYLFIYFFLIFFTELSSCGRLARIGISFFLSDRHNIIFKLKLSISARCLCVMCVHLKRREQKKRALIKHLFSPQSSVSPSSSSPSPSSLRQYVLCTPVDNNCQMRTKAYVMYAVRNILGIFVFIGI